MTTGLPIEWKYCRAAKDEPWSSGLFLAVALNKHGAGRTFALDDNSLMVVDITLCHVRVIRFPRLRRITRRLISLFKPTEAAR